MYTVLYHKCMLWWYTIKEKVYFWPSNFYLNLVLAIEVQNRISLTIQLLKPIIIGLQVGLMGDINFFIYNLILRT
jgi:hypothetical protein